MKENKVLYLIATGVIVIALLGAFFFGFYNNHKKTISYSEDEKVHISLNFAYQNNPWNLGIQSIVQSFEEEHPDIVVEFSPQYENEVYEDALLKKIARDELGDIVQLKTPKAYVENGIFAPIDQEIYELSTFNYEYNGQVYAIGVVETTWGVLYNKTMFEAYNISVPKTYEEFIAICETIERNGKAPIGVGGADLWHMEYWINHFFKTDVLSKNENWLSDCSSGKVAWTDAELRRMMEHLKQVFKYANANWQKTSDTSVSYLLSEREVAMVYTGPWAASSVNANDENMQLGWFYLPDSNGVTHVAQNQDTYWGVTQKCAQDSRKYEAAMEFLKYFYTCDKYIELCHNTYTFPAYVNSVPEEDAFILKEVRDAFVYSDKKYTAYIGDENCPLGFEKEMLLCIQDILLDACDVDTGLSRMQQSWEECKKKEVQP